MCGGSMIRGPYSHEPARLEVVLCWACRDWVNRGYINTSNRPRQVCLQVNPEVRDESASSWKPGAVTDILNLTVSQPL